METKLKETGKEQLSEEMAEQLNDEQVYDEMLCEERGKQLSEERIQKMLEEVFREFLRGEMGWFTRWVKAGGYTSLDVKLHGQDSEYGDVFVSDSSLSFSLFKDDDGEVVKRLTKKANVTA